MPPGFEPWSKGKTKDSDARLRRMSESQIKGRKFGATGYAYVYMPEHPSNYQGYVAEHTAVVEKAIGRFLYKHEVVHHVNHDRGDNRIENLQLMDRREHFALHGRAKKPRTKLGQTFLCLICGAGLYRNPSQIAQGAGKYCSVVCLKKSGSVAGNTVK